METTDTEGACEMETSEIKEHADRAEVAKT